MAKKHKIVDLFAGIGGIRLGFSQAMDIECVLSNEINKQSARTYEANFNENPLGDITKIKESDVPDHDLLVGGFPCQAFSLAGKKQGFEDTRGTLFFDIARILKKKKPKAFLLENVKGLVSHDKGNTFKVILQTLNDLGYEVHHKILNASYFGVAQKRERIYIVGFLKSKIKNAKEFTFPNPASQSLGIKSILEKNVDSSYFLSNQYWKTLQDHKSRHADKGNGFGYEIIDGNKLANTLVVGGMGRERNLVVDNSAPINKDNKPRNNLGIRMMTPREWARLQGFPDSFKLTEAKTTSYKQLGNSVAVPVIKAIALEMKKILET